MHTEEFNDYKDYFEEQEKKKGPIKLIIGLFVLLILIFSFIPYYVLKLDPNPDYTQIDSLNIEPYIPNVRGRAANIESAPTLTDVKEYRLIANKIVSEACQWESNVCYAKAIFYFVQKRIKYIADPQQGYIQLPAETLASGGGDCEDLSLLLATLLEAIGFDADVGLTHNHAFVRVQIKEALWRYKSDGDYVYLDPTCNECKFGQVKFKNKDIIKFVEL